jgi:hypothetical protein
MTVPGVWPQVLDFFGTPLVVEPSPGQLSGDAGLLPLRQFDERVGLTGAFAEALDDPRDADLTEHTFREMVRSRVYGILAGYQDRLSDHRFVANYFRLYLHAAAMNLLVRLRRFIAEPLPALTPQAETVSPTNQPGEAAGPADEPCVPVEALTGPERQRHFRLRRQRDPLGEGHPCTWRTLLIKVAAEVVVRTRQIVVRLSSSWPHLDWYRRGRERLRVPLPIPVDRPSG